MDTLNLILLDDLCFIDGRDDEYAAERERLRAYGKVGVPGPFQALFGEKGHYVDEVASVYAEVFHRLGYLTAVEPRDEPDWPAFVAGLRHRFAQGDHRRSEVESEIGRPSLAIGTVWCYVPAGASGAWVFFDFAVDRSLRYQRGEGTFRQTDDDPLLRDVRLPAPTFEAGLVLTLYGRVLRWGTGWWTAEDTEPHAAPDGVAEQLRAIEAADPSQALRRPPPSGYRPD